MTADHTPERLSAEEREAICRAGFSTHDHLLQRDPALAAFEAILAAHLADVEARLPAVEALADEWAADPDGLPRADVCARKLRAALHPAPSEVTRDE